VGAMRADGSGCSEMQYAPHAAGAWQPSPEHEEPALAPHGNVQRWDYREDYDNYSSAPGKLFRLMDADPPQRLFENTARNMEGVDEHIKHRHIVHCHKADPAYGEGVCKALGMNLEEVLKAPQP